VSAQVPETHEIESIGDHQADTGAIPIGGYPHLAKPVSPIPIATQPFYLGLMTPTGSS